VKPNPKKRRQIKQWKHKLSKANSSFKVENLEFKENQPQAFLGRLKACENFLMMDLFSVAPSHHYVSSEWCPSSRNNTVCQKT